MSSQIVNHIIDISVLARNLKNIQFIYCNRDMNRLVDKIAKQVHCTLNNVCHCLS